MARAYPNPASPDSTPAGELMALRGELEALLDQVEGQVQGGRAIDTISQRVRNLRQQVGEVAPDRQREALRTVQRQVERFNSPADSGPEANNPRVVLHSAIEEIRARQQALRPRVPGETAARPAYTREPAYAPQPAPVATPNFDALTRSVNTITARLEGVETALKAQAQSQTGIKEVADQVQQLTQVVELLAGAVGETGQVKRLETQIAGLAKLMAQAPKIDVSAVTTRLDELSSTVERLADLQIRQVERTLAGDDGQKSQLVAVEAIEAGVRNIYDRIDAIERSWAMTPDDLERLTGEMAAFTETMRAGPPASAGVSDLLLDRLDALHGSVAGIADIGNGALGGLKSDIASLRQTLVEALEPRFAGIETRLAVMAQAIDAEGRNASLTALEAKIDALADQVTDEKHAISLSNLEAQIRQLVARMDQTGEQLSGLARLYNERPADVVPLAAPAQMPDFEAMGATIAKRAAEAVSRAKSQAQATLSDAGLDAVEARLRALIEGAPKPAPVAPPDMSAVNDGLTRVDDRLGKLEQALAKLAAMQASPTPVPAPVAVPAPMPAAPPARAPETMPAPRPVQAEAPLPPRAARSDAMPTPPSQDGPVQGRSFDDLGPVRAALEARMQAQAEAELPPPRPRPPEAVLPPARPVETLPPKPVSRLVADPRTSEARHSAPIPPPATDETGERLLAGSRNTFIEAARRAAQRQTAAPAEPVAGNSLIGRALSRFQPSREAAALATLAPEVKSKPIPPAKAMPIKKARAEKPARRPEADAAPAVTLPEAAPAEDGEPRESFLLRHRRAILLAATFVAVLFLAINLIGQRMAQQAQPAPAPAPLVTPAAPAQVGDATPRVIEPAAADWRSATPSAQAQVPLTIDNATTGSTSKLMFSAEALNAPPPVEIAPATFTPALAAISAITPHGEPSLAVPPQPPAPAPQFAPPPVALGPEPLRLAAASGDRRAQFEVAAIYTEGRVLPQDMEQAAIWYERSANQGFAPSQYRLANLYENGQGVAKNLEQARAWYERAAHAGNRMSMHNLAALYAGGQLGSQDFAAAVTWFEKAARLGLRDSQFNLGMLYARGLGVEQDMGQSYTWFSLAAKQGDADAAKARDDMLRSLDAETVARLDDELTIWRPAILDLPANFAPIGTWSTGFDPGPAITTAEVVKRVQEALTRLGYDIGTPDGLPGPKTADAIKAFERATGMSEVGAINPRLLAVLGSQPV